LDLIENCCGTILGSDEEVELLPIVVCCEVSFFVTAVSVKLLSIRIGSSSFGSLVEGEGREEVGVLLQLNNSNRQNRERCFMGRVV
jgi:hypothetical protein